MYIKSAFVLTLGCPSTCDESDITYITHLELHTSSVIHNINVISNCLKTTGGVSNNNAV